MMALCPILRTTLFLSFITYALARLTEQDEHAKGPRSPSLPVGFPGLQLNNNSVSQLSRTNLTVPGPRGSRAMQNTNQLITQCYNEAMTKYGVHGAQLYKVLIERFLVPDAEISVSQPTISLYFNTLENFVVYEIRDANTDHPTCLRNNRPPKDEDYKRALRSFSFNSKQIPMSLLEASNVLDAFGARSERATARVIIPLEWPTVDEKGNESEPWHYQPYWEILPYPSPWDGYWFVIDMKLKRVVHKYPIWPDEHAKRSRSPPLTVSFPESQLNNESVSQSSLGDLTVPGPELQNFNQLVTRCYDKVLRRYGRDGVQLYEVSIGWVPMPGVHPGATRLRIRLLFSRLIRNFEFLKVISYEILNAETIIPRCVHDSEYREYTGFKDGTRSFRFNSDQVPMPLLEAYGIVKAFGVSLGEVDARVVIPEEWSAIDAQGKESEPWQYTPYWEIKSRLGGAPDYWWLVDMKLKRVVHKHRVH